MTPPLSKRRRILDALKSRVERIRGVHGFATEAGRIVEVGAIPELGPDDPSDAVAVRGGPDEWQQQGLAFHVVWPITIWALTKSDREQPYLAVETILADIERAVETDDLTLGGLVIQHLERTPPRIELEREPGSLVVGVGVTYTAVFKEGWGTP